MSVKRLLPLLLVLGLATPAWAQQQSPVLVQSVPQETRASVTCAEARGTGAQTLTISGVGGKYFYVNFLAAEAFAVGTAVSLSTPASLTTTNISGTPTFGTFAVTAQTAGQKLDSYQFALSGNGLKTSAPGTNTTIVAPSVTNVGWHIVACGYYADAP